MKEIADCIRTLRLKRQLTQAQLASALGVQYQTVSKWENNISTPDIPLLPVIADFFGISLDELFGRRRNGCATSISDSDAAFLLQTYSQMYAPEAGPWNLSAENKYLEYKFRAFLKPILSSLRGQRCATSASVPVSGTPIFPISWQVVP